MITVEKWGTLADGRAVERITLRIEGLEVACLTYGAAIQSLLVPDREGRMGDVVLGHDRLEDYVAERNFFGATIGPVANRIGDAGFDLDGKRYALTANNGPNTLHGGSDGFDRQLWTLADKVDGAEPAITLALTSPDGEGGFPGNLAVRVTYALKAPATLEIRFEAESDAATPVVLTNHAFFNLGGVAEPTSILEHRLRIEADRYLAVDESLIPEGDPQPVEGTPFDFRKTEAIGRRIRDADRQLEIAGGYDHNFCLSDGFAEAPRLAARVEDPVSGRVMDLLTDQPGLQFYSGNFLTGRIRGKGGRLYRQADAFCLEPQAWPNAVNRPDFASPILRPGESYRHHSIYRFSISYCDTNGPAIVFI